MEPKKVRPALYSFPDSTWAWIKLAELAKILGIAPMDCWEKYHTIPFKSFKCPRFVSVHYPNEGGVKEHSINGLSEMGVKVVFVPAGWALKILQNADMVFSDSAEPLDTCQRCQSQVILNTGRCPVCGFFND